MTNIKFASVLQNKCGVLRGACLFCALFWQEKYHSNFEAHRIPCCCSNVLAATSEVIMNPFRQSIRGFVAASSPFLQISSEWTLRNLKKSSYLHSAVVRAHLEYVIQANCPFPRKDLYHLERIKRAATRAALRLQSLSLVRLRDHFVDQSRQWTTMGNPSLHQRYLRDTSPTPPKPQHQSGKSRGTPGIRQYACALRNFLLLT